MVLTKEIKVPLYDGYLALIITDEDVKVSKYYDDLDSELSVDFAHAQRINVKKNGKLKAGYLAAFNISNKYEHITNGTIAHEAFHVTSYVADRIGMELSEKSEEAYTYLLMWIVNEIHKFFDENKIKIHLNKHVRTSN